MNYIELFAGCGGLSLGLQSVGFELLMANELSPMAAESYAYNFFGEDLQAQATSKNPKLKKTLWLNSKHALTDLRLRLREDPRTTPPLGEGVSDIAHNRKDLKGSLIVGSIVDLNLWLHQTPTVAQALLNGFGDGGIDLVSGGPPCQSFSMAGLRKKDCEKNTLPWEFAKFVWRTQPKLVALENVTGILRPFKDEKGRKIYAWFELAKAFSAIGYIPLCLHVNAKFSGVPQSRPRFILIGVREDFYYALSPTFNTAEQALFSQPLNFMNRARDNQEIELDTLRYYDMAKPEDMALFQNSFLAPLVVRQNNFVTVCEAIDDLRTHGNRTADFPVSLTQAFGQVLPEHREIKNHEYRKNGTLVRCRFRLYQILKQVDNKAHKMVSTLNSTALYQTSNPIRERRFPPRATFSNLCAKSTSRRKGLKRPQNRT